MNDIYGDILDNPLDNYFCGNEKPTVHYTKKAIASIDPEETVDSSERMQAENTMGSIKEFGEELNNLLKKAWGTSWGTISPEVMRHSDSKRVITPQISFSTNLRQYSDQQGSKPRLMQTIIEKVNNVETGYMTRVYSEIFDNIIEFNFWDSSSLSAEELMTKFEELIIIYTDYLKNKGLTDIYFLKEVPSKYSLKNIEGENMKCIYLFVKFERIRTFRIKALKNVKQKIEIKDRNTIY